MIKDFINLADRSAIVLSSLCVIHCLLLPFVLITIPALTSFAFFDDESFHIWLLVAVIPTSIFAVTTGYAYHKRWSVVIVTSLGLIVLALVATFGHEFFGERGEVIASVVGSIFVAGGHIKNLRGRKISYPCRKIPTDDPV